MMVDGGSVETSIMVEVDSVTVGTGDAGAVTLSFYQITEKDDDLKMCHT
jgi:hypothetical protein